jgi:hypothetical protein
VAGNHRIADRSGMGLERQDWPISGSTVAPLRSPSLADGEFRPRHMRSTIGYSLPDAERSGLQGQAAEIRRLKAEQKRVSEERDMLKIDRGGRCQRVPVRYSFIQSYETQYLCAGFVTL